MQDETSQVEEGPRLSALQAAAVAQALPAFPIPRALHGKKKAGLEPAGLQRGALLRGAQRPCQPRASQLRRSGGTAAASPGHGRVLHLVEKPSSEAL